MAVLGAIVKFVRRVFGTIFGNPFLTLGFVVLAIALLNYRTLVSELPTSMPEVEAWIVESSPLTFTLGGEVEGAENCWEMQFIFLDGNGERILQDRDYVQRIREPRPETTITVPDLDAYTITIVTELTNAQPSDLCIPEIGLVVVSASRMTVTAGDLPDQTRVVNRCTRAEGRFDCSVSYE